MVPFPPCPKRKAGVTMENEYIKRALIVLLVGLITSLVFKLSFRKVQEETSKLTDKIKKNKGWQSPLFANVGFIVGSLILLMWVWYALPDMSKSLLKISKLAGAGADYSVLILCIFWFLGGIWFMAMTPYIHLDNHKITWQPLILRFIGVQLFKKEIDISRIKDVTNETTVWMISPFAGTKLVLVDGREQFLHTEFFSPIISTALREVLSKRKV